jgi:rsbT antagonist protein RsbS
MDKIPILKIADYLLVPIHVDMDDQLAMDLQDQLTEAVSKRNIKGVLIDISLLDVVDSFIGRMLGTISKMAQVLGAKTVVVGMQPAVAITIVELGLNMLNIQTALNAEKGMALIKKLNEQNSGSIQPDV